MERWRLHGRNARTYLSNIWKEQKVVIMGTNQAGLVKLNQSMSDLECSTQQYKKINQMKKKGSIHRVRLICILLETAY
jgi:hypothetical protein